MPPSPTRRAIQLVLALGLTALVSGCQLALPRAGRTADGEVTANAIAGDAIEVTALDATAGAGPVDSAAAAEPPAEVAATDPQPTAAPPAEAAPAPVAEETAAEAPPPPPKSEAQLACEKKKGSWVTFGKGTLRTCIFSTKDAGKSCTRSSQCDGQCLARSGTCSPLKPLMGCNEILQDNGARVTECIE